MIWQRGYIQVYTGNGKGKTTAALGLALRAVGAGMKVYFGQFLKARDCAEVAGLSLLGAQVTLERFGSGRWVDRSDAQAYSEELELGRNGLESVRKAIASGEYKVIVLDEILGALKQGVVRLEEVVALLQNKPPEVELVLTGRDVPQEIAVLADLISEISPVKHYYKSGVPARRGIEF